MSISMYVTDRANSRTKHNFVFDLSNWSKLLIITFQKGIGFHKLDTRTHFIFYFRSHSSAVHS